MLTLPPLLWAGNAVIGRLMVDHAPPLLLNALRWTGTLVLLLPLSWRVLATREQRAQIRARWRHLALLGLLGVGSFNSLQYLALRTSTPLNVTLIGASMPLWMMVSGALLFRVRPHARDALAAMLSLAGVVVVLTRGQPWALSQLEFVPGDWFMLVAAACWSVYSWLLARPPATMRGDARPPWDWAGFLLVQVLFGLAWAWLSTAGEAIAWPQRPPLRWDWAFVLALAYLVIFPSLVAYHAWGVGVAQAGPAMAALFSNLTPLFAALISAAALGTWPEAHHLLAFALIVGGIAASALRPAARAVAEGPA